MAINHDTSLHIAMYPFFAMGHITSFLRISNKLAERGHKISFFLPTKTISRFSAQNHHPDRITFIPITMPHVDGLPKGAETSRDVTGNTGLIMASMDLTYATIETLLIDLKPNFIFFDFAQWIPGLAKKHGIKSVCYYSGFLVRYAYILRVVLSETSECLLIKDDHFVNPPLSFPSPQFKLQPFESRDVTVSLKSEFGDGVLLAQRIGMSIRDCDAIGVKSSREMEGSFCEFVENICGKPVLTAGPVLPDPQPKGVNNMFDAWLTWFSRDTVVYCAFGSECDMDLSMMHELLLGLELTGRPFLAALKPPKGYKSIESALPEGFLERTKDRGIVYDGWVQQQLILKHPSVGCFITHCGAGSLSEAMVNKCQLVMIPHDSDQFINAKMMHLELKVGVEVEKNDEYGLFDRYAVLKAVEAVMDMDSVVGKEVRANHTKWREFILKEGVEDSYISRFIHGLRELLFV